MIHRRAALLGLGAGAAGAAWAQESSPEDSYQGEWFGVLQAGSITLRLRLVVNGAGATLYSIDQGDAAIPAASVSYAGGALSLAFPTVNASYRGAFEGGAIRGTFTQGAAVPLDFHRTRQAAVTALPNALDAARLEALRARAGSPALAAAAASREGRRVNLATGLRASNAAARVTTSDKWHLGSITKSMTATLAALHVEAGVLRWDEKLEDVLPEAAGTPYAKATLLHLMSHRAGLQANLAPVRMLAYRRENPAPIAERRAYVVEAFAQEPVGPMEETYLYSNTGFITVGAMLEAKTGTAWEDLIRTRLFEPLGMASAGFGPPGTPGALDQPVGHLGDALAPTPPGGFADNPAVLSPAGRVHCSLEDLLKFAATHRDRVSMLTRASWDKMHTPPFGGDYALGLVKRGDTLWHNGTNARWYAEMLIDPGRGFVSAAAANDGRGGAATAVGEALIGAVAAIA